MSREKNLAVFFILIACAIVAACARGDGDRSTSGQGADLRDTSWSREGWGFSLEDPGLSGDASALRTAFLTKDRIYYAVIEDEGQRSQLYRIPDCGRKQGVFLSTGELTVYGILSGGQKKDGAWEFIESSLENFHAHAATSTVIPVQRADLEADIARLLDLSYEKDGEGNILTDENGSPVRQVSGRHNGIPQYYPEKKDAQDYRRILENMRMIPLDRYNPVCTILYEEIQTYFNGQKTLDEAIDILQSRIGLYMGEIQ